MTDDKDVLTGNPTDYGSEDRLWPPEVLKLDYVYEALNHPRRRYLCYSLYKKSEWSMRDLASKIAAWENDCSEDATTDRQVSQVYVSLYHMHVPKLVNLNVVTYKDGEERVASAENTGEVGAALLGMWTGLDDFQESQSG